MGVTSTKSLPTDSETDGVSSSGIILSNNDDIHYEAAELSTSHLQTPLRFHSVRGRNITLSPDGRSASRNEKSFCDGIVFTNRPIKVNEKVKIGVLKLSSFWNGAIRLGFTSVDPNTFHPKTNQDPTNKREENCECSLPKYVYPDLTNKRGYWAASMTENSLKQSDVVFFYVNRLGEIHYGINGSYLGKFLEGVEMESRLWGVIDVYGNTLSIELKEEEERPVRSRVALTDCASFNSIGSNGSSSISSSVVTVIPNHNLQPNNEDRLDQLLISFRRLCVDNHLNETLHHSIYSPGTIQRDTQNIKTFYKAVPLLLHEPVTDPKRQSILKFIASVHGVNVEVSEERVACRAGGRRMLQACDGPTRNAYVFLDRPIEKGRNFCVQIVGVENSEKEARMSLGVGCTTCDPRTLTCSIDLPDDSHDLLDRPEYWVVYKNLCHKYKLGLADELCFRVDDASGDLHLTLNGDLVEKCLFSVDSTQKLWFFFDLCGSTSALRLIPSCQGLPSSSTKETRRRSRPNSALIELYRNQLSSEKTITNTKNEAKQESNKDDSECRICWDAPVECVFYSCGHMCLCWKCANNLKEQVAQKNESTSLTSGSLETASLKTERKKPQCPICRNEIIDIIRFFKS